MDQLSIDEDDTFVTGTGDDIVNGTPESAGPPNLTPPPPTAVGTPTVGVPSSWIGLNIAEAFNTATDLGIRIRFDSIDGEMFLPPLDGFTDPTRVNVTIVDSFVVDAFFG